MPASTFCWRSAFARWRRASRGTAMGRTMAAKIWDDHLVAAHDGEPDLLYVDLHLVHEVTSPQAFESLRLNNRRAPLPDLPAAPPDHYLPPRRRRASTADRPATHMPALEEDDRPEGTTLFVVRR